MRWLLPWTTEAAPALRREHARSPSLARKSQAACGDGCRSSTVSLSRFAFGGHASRPSSGPALTSEGILTLTTVRVDPDQVAEVIQAAGARPAPAAVANA